MSLTSSEFATRLRLATVHGGTLFNLCGEHFIIYTSLLVNVVNVLHLRVVTQVINFFSHTALPLTNPDSKDRFLANVF